MRLLYCNNMIRRKKDEYTKEFNIVSHDQKQEEVDEDALALLQQYD